MSSTSHIVVQPAHFDKNCLRISTHQASSFTKSNQKFTNIKSEIEYRAGPPGTNTYKKLYIVAPTQQVFGFSKQYETGKKETAETFKGYQVGYPVSNTTSPTPDEKAFIDVLESIHAAVVEAGKLEVENHKKLLKEKKVSTFYGNAVGSYTQALEMDDMNSFIKPLLSQPMIKDSNPPKEDLSKPQRLYLPLIGKKNFDTGVYSVQTQVFGPGGKRLNVEDHVSSVEPKIVKRGNMTPLIEFSHVYWGSHNTKPYAGSIKAQIAQCNYVPLGGSSVPMQSLLPAVGDDAGEYDDGNSGGSHVELPDGEDCFSKPSTTDLAAELAKNRRVPVAEAAEALERPAPESVVASASVPEVPKTTRVRKVVPKAEPAA